MRTRTIIGLLIVVAIVSTAIGSYQGYRWGVAHNKTIPPTSLVGEIKKIEELNVIEYSFNSVDELKDSYQIGDTNIPCTEKRIKILVPGTIKYHVDLKKIENSDIDVKDRKKTITINMPALEADTIVDVNKVKYYDKKNNLFNPLKLEDSDELEAKAIKAAQKQAEGEGIIEEGQNNAEAIIQKLVDSLPEYQEYDVVCNFN